MYRPKKRKFLRRAAVTSTLALVAVTGLGVTLLSQGGATSTNPPAATTAANTANTATLSPVSTATISVPKFHVVGTRHDDSQHSGDD